MGMKLHRSRQSVFRKKHTWLRSLAWVVGCAAVIVLGFFIAKTMDAPSLDETPASSAPSDNTTITTTTPTAPSKPAATQPDENTPLRGFYLPIAALHSDTLTDTLTQAAQAGFTAVVFDLKDSDGRLYYHFTSQAARQVNSFTEDAFTTEQLTQLFSTMKAAGLQPVPRLYAFRDNLGAKALGTARIGLAGNPSWTWYDGDPNGNGRAWLNPYADEAHSYLIGLAQELKAAGAAAVMLDGVQFPHQISSAHFGSSSNTNLSHSEVLTLFVDKMKEALEDCPVILACTTQSAIGNETQAYGGNPLTFAPTMASPAILPTSLPATITIGETVITNTTENPQQTVQALVSQMVLRTKVMAEDSRPTILPWLQAEGYTAAQIQQEISGCAAAGCEAFILYNAAGTYDFAALPLH